MSDLKRVLVDFKRKSYKDCFYLFLVLFVLVFFLPSFEVDEAVSRSRTNSQRFKLSFWFFFIDLSGCDRFRSVFRVHSNVFQPKSLQRNQKRKKNIGTTVSRFLSELSFRKKKSERRKKSSVQNIRSLFRGGMFLKTRSIHEKRKK